MATSAEETRRILVELLQVRERFYRLDRTIRTHKHEESRKFSEISENCGYMEVRKNRSNTCHAVRTPSLHRCRMGVCPFIKEAGRGGE